MSFIARRGSDRFDVDFSRAPDRPLLDRILSRPSGRVDPYRVGLAIIAAINACEVRGATGRALIWNDFRVFLSRADFDSMYAVLRRSIAGLDGVVRAAIVKRGGEIVGDPTLHIQFDEAMDLEPGRGVVLCAHRETQAPEGESPHELTIRLGARVEGAEATQRVIDAPSASGEKDARLRWPGGQALIRAGTIGRLGRPHANPPPDFIPLEGAKESVNRLQLIVDNTGDQLVLIRPPEANAVHVGRTLLAPGGRIGVEKTPVQITLSNDQLVLELDRP